MRRLLMAMLGCGVLVVHFAASPHVDWRLRLDRRLTADGNQPSTSVRALIHARPGRAADLRNRLTQQPEVQFGAQLADPDLVAATFPSRLLRKIATDADVTNVSSDAMVKSLDNKWLGQNVLLDTEGLLALKPDGKVSRKLRYTGHNIGVALIDSGFFPNGDLNDVTFFDFTQGGKKGSPYDDYGHGTHVAGLMGSGGGMSSSQYAGVAPDCKYIVLKVLDENGNGYTSDVIAAVDFAVANKDALHIDIINLSLGHPIYEPAATDPLVQAVERAVASGLVVVASAGNFGGDPDTKEPEYAGVTSPGNAPDAITVGAVDTLQTTTRSDDHVAWYSSRGPTWYDGFQKPDVVAPGSHLVSDISTKSTLFNTFKRGLVMVKDKPFMMLSGTSMSAGVVTGIVADMLEASRTNFPPDHNPPLTPNAVKAILEYTAQILPNEDVLSQGAGAVNGDGAIALAESIDPGAPVGAPWLTTGVNPYTTIGGEQVMWGQRIVWGDRIIWGNQMLSNDPAFGMRIVWGDRVIWGNRIVWGNSTVWDFSSQSVWGTRIVWGDALVGATDGLRIVWGDRIVWGNLSADRIVWGNLQGLNIAPTSMSWGNLERSNIDIK